MDLKNTALLEAFKKKYGGIKTDEEDLRRFAKKYYGLDKKEEPSLLEKAKETIKGIVEMNAARRSGDTKKIEKAYDTANRGF
jgi:hypothetical protein